MYQGYVYCTRTWHKTIALRATCRRSNWTNQKAAYSAIIYAIYIELDKFALKTHEKKNMKKKYYICVRYIVRIFSKRYISFTDTVFCPKILVEKFLRCQRVAANFEYLTLLKVSHDTGSWLPR